MVKIDCCIQYIKYSKDYGIKILTLGKKLTFCTKKLMKIFITLRYYRINGVAQALLPQEIVMILFLIGSVSKIESDKKHVWRAM